MKPFFLRWLLLVIIFAGIGTGIRVGTLGAQQPAAATLEGRWRGTLAQAPDQVQLVVNIDRGADGRLRGSVIGLNGVNPYAIEAIEQSGTMVRLVVGEASGGFEGVLSADGTRLTGAWSQLAIATPLELTRSPASPSPLPPPRADISGRGSSDSSY